MSARSRTGFAFAFAQIAAAVVACGGTTSSSTTTPVTGDGGQPPPGACGLKILDELNPASPFDYVALRSEVVVQSQVRRDAGADDGASDAGPTYDLVTLSHNVSTAESFGTECKTATDAASCRTKLADLRVLTPPASGSGRDCVDRQFTPQGCSATYVVVTQGDNVTALDTPATVAAALGRIDTADEAWLVARVNGRIAKCSDKHPAETPRATQGGDGYELVFLEYGQCTPKYRVRVRVGSDGSYKEIERTELEKADCAIGRRPEGLCARANDDASTPAELFARAARLEHASVFAFRRLASELRGFGAPRALVSRARRSAREETRHARTTTRIARRLGGKPARARVDANPRRSLFDLARENAVEGCIRETYGALLAAYQARTAEDPEIRKEVSRIARDEAAHAELSWRVHRWSMGRLGRAQRSELQLAMRRALADLTLELSIEPSPAVARTCGVPRAAVALDLLSKLFGVRSAPPLDFGNNPAARVVEQTLASAVEERV
jgi:hypothetical protein